MFQQFDHHPYPGGEPGGPHLTTAEAVLIWSIRRLAFTGGITRPRCPAVHIALQQHFGANGAGVEHLLRCCLFGLAQVSRRTLSVGTPACPKLCGDEIAMVALFRCETPDAIAAGLIAITDNPVAADRWPLFEALSRLIRP